MQPAWPQVTDEAEQARRAEIIEQARPEHEKVVVVRVPSAAPTYQAKLPQERWLAALMILPMFYVTYYLSIILLTALNGALGGAVACGAVVAVVMTSVVIVVRRLFTRPEVALDSKGLRYKTTGFIGSSGTIALDKLRGFTVQVKRRAMDNNEQWHLFATTDGKPVFIGKTGKHDEAAAIIRGLEETLAQLRLSSTNYRVGF
ncbi:MAG: hypothetical protein U0269_24815 [Polyangiales bacterium]